MPAVYVYLRRSDEVLLQLRQNTGFMDGYWAAAVAGHVLAGESVTGAAIREAAEETGVVLTATDLVPLTVLHRTDGSLLPVEQRVDFFFECHSWWGEPEVLEPHKATALRWFPLGDLPPRVPPHERHVLAARLRGTLPAFAAIGFREDRPRAPQRPQQT